MKIKFLLLLGTACSLSVVTGCNQTQEQYDSIEATIAKENYMANDTVTYGDFAVFGVKQDGNKKNLTDFKIEEFGESDKYTFSTEDEGTKTFHISYNDLNTTCSTIVAVIPVQKIEIEEPYVFLDNKEGYRSKQLTAHVIPSDASNPKLKWTSSNEAVATVDENGLVTIAKDAIYNYCTITATSEENETITKSIYTVNFSDFKPVTNVDVNPNTLDLEIGKTEKLSVTIKPDDASHKSVYWVSENEEIATVDEEGSVKAISSGTTVIKACSYDGYATGTCTVTVPEIQVEKIILDPKEMKLKEGGTTQKISVSYEPSHATVKQLTWESSDTNVATVDENGLVTSVNPGKATITATAISKNSKVSATCAVTVSPDVIPVTNINASDIEFTNTKEEGPTKKISYTVLPDDATDKRVNFYSQNTDVATVDNEGVVTALKPGGETKIIIKSVSNPNVSTSIKVSIDKDKVLPLRSLSLSETETVICKDSTISLDIIRVPGTSTETLSAVCSDESIATLSVDNVNNKLIIEASKTKTSDGSALITVYCDSNHDIKVTCKVLYLGKCYFGITNEVRNLELGVTLPITFTTKDPASIGITLESLNPNVCEIVDTYSVYTKGYGYATIVAKAEGYLDQSIIIDVSDFSKVKIVNNNTVKNGDTNLLNVDLHLPNYYWNNSDKKSYEVTTIAEKGFEGAKMVKVFFGEKIKFVKTHAFNNCRNLVSLTTNELIETIEKDVFASCPSLIELNINSPYVAKLESDVCQLFLNAKILRLNQKAKQAVTDKSFVKKLDLEEIKLSDEETVYQEEATFISFSELTKVDGGLRLENTGAGGGYPAYTTVPDYVNYEYKGTYLPIVETCNFSGGTISNFVCPSTLKKLGKFNKSVLREADISKCINLNDHALVDDQFSHNGILSTVYLPGNLLKIGRWAFKGDVNLKICGSKGRNQLPDTIEELCDYCFNQCSSLTNVNFPENLKTIGTGAFHSSGLSGTLTFNNKLETISNDAFYNCKSITGVVLPVSLKSLNNYAFEGCSNLENVTYKGTMEQYNAISKKSPFKSTKVGVIHCSDGDIEYKNS